jgi:hypothetical protein
MHEPAVTEGILKVVLGHAAANGAVRVVGVGLRIGEGGPHLGRRVYRPADRGDLMDAFYTNKCLHLC